MSFIKPLSPELHHEVDDVDEDGKELKRMITDEYIHLKPDQITYNYRRAFETALGIPFESLNGKTGAEMLPYLVRGIDDIIDNTDVYKELNPEGPNAYGTWIGLLRFLNNLRKKVLEHPDAVYHVS